MEQTLRLADIFDLLDVIINADDVKNHKPHPEPIKKALRKLGALSESAVMVGDTDVDVLAGKNAGVVTIGVTYGFHGEKIRKSNPDFLIDDISEILKIVL